MGRLEEAHQMLDTGFAPLSARSLVKFALTDKHVCGQLPDPRKSDNLHRTTLRDFIQVNIGSMELSANHRITQVVEVVSEYEKRDK